jgi:hypothetical protein
MRPYRLFLVDVLRRVQEERKFDAPSDGEAMRLADKLRGSSRAELWNTHHRIARWD